MAQKKKTTLTALAAKKQAGQKIVVLTCYDYPTAQIQAEAGVDAILVGDSYGQVVLGYDSTLPVTVDQMITITAAVRRGAPDVFLIGDMPYLSYQVSHEQAIRNAGRFMAEAGCDCVKVEVDQRLADTVAAMSRAGIPVMAHLGLRPQSVHQLGGYRTQGRTAQAAAELARQAEALEEAGACALLLEAVPPEPARIVAEQTHIIVIGCGAGPHVDGHVVVVHDILGWLPGAPPRFAPRYTSVRRQMMRAFKRYVADVAGGQYPSPEQWYPMADGQADKLEGSSRPGSPGH